MNHRSTLLTASLLGLTGVGLGAFGTHQLRGLLLEKGTSSNWDTAARYQLIHAAVVFAAAAWLRAGTGPGTVRMQWAVRCWTAGTILFSGSLYGYAVGGPRFLVFLTPVGGVTLIIGWLMAVAAAFVVKDP